MWLLIKFAAGEPIAIGLLSDLPRPRAPINSAASVHVSEFVNSFHMMMWNWLNSNRTLTTISADGQEMVNVLSQVCRHRHIVASKSRIYFPKHMMLK